MSSIVRSEREELTRAMARLGGVPYADELDDDAETLFPYRGEADTLLAEGFGRRSEVTESLVWSALEPYLETVIGLDLNRYADSQAFREMVATVTTVIRTGDENAEPVKAPPAPRVISSIRELPWWGDAVAKSQEVIARIPIESLPSWIQDRESARRAQAAESEASEDPEKKENS